ncbi:MAG: gamma-glutamyltransferase [Thermomicrobiales bacterium]
MTSATDAQFDAQPDRSTWRASRSSVRSRRGVVVAKTPQAVDAGLAMLRKGGNAIDAAVATAFAAGVAEPWMNGLGGGGFMVVWLAAEKRSVAIEFQMLSAAGATPEMFPLSGGVDSGLFGWPSVVDNANVLGYRSIAVPGTVAGLTRALERFGTLPLATVMEPAIEIAESGFPVTWHTTLTTAKDLGNLQRFPETARTYLDMQGNPLTSLDPTNPTYLRQPDLARTLGTIAEQGPRAFYEGEIAHAIVDHLAANGSPLTREDFAAYEAVEAESAAVDYHGHRVHTVGKGSGGTSLAQMVQMLARVDFASLGHNSPEALHLLAQAFRQAFADRFAYLADPEAVEVPIEALLSREYAEENVARWETDRLPPIRTGSKERLGVRHALQGSVPEYARDGSTTHLGVIDGEGNAVSLTQTLLSGWGSRVVAPGTGVLLNNGMMWFDPEPGRPNSVGGRKRPLANMAPVVVTKGDQVMASIGSSGGRKITNCNVQLMTNLVDFGMDMRTALESPRIDASTRKLTASSRLAAGTLARLRELGHTLDIRDETLLTGDFASPVAIARQDDGMLEGAADPWYYPATAGCLSDCEDD